jgi:hypothetical protein
VPEHDIPAGARILAITAESGANAYLHVDGAQAFAGYRDIVAALERWTAYIRTEPSDKRVPYGLVVDQRGT